MTNRLTNAGFLDGTAGWEALDDCTLAVDETTLGAPGRLVLVVTCAVDDAPIGVLSDVVSLSAGDALFLRVLAADAAGHGAAVTLEREGEEPVVLPVRARLATAAPARGLAEGLTSFVAQGEVPTTGDWRLRIEGAGPMTGARTLVVYRPQISDARDDGLPPPFDPGGHDNADLDLPAWPAAMRPFQAGSNPEPLPDRLGFQTATGHNRTRRLMAQAPVDFRGRVRCTAAELDALTAFHAAGHAAFHVVRPDTDQLCVASWQPGGAPRVVESRGPTVIAEVGLQLTLA